MQVTPKLAILSSTGHAGYYLGELFNGPMHCLGPLFSFFVVHPLFQSPSQAVTKPRPLLTQMSWLAKATRHIWEACLH